MQKYLKELTFVIIAQSLVFGCAKLSGESKGIEVPKINLGNFSVPAKAVPPATLTVNKTQTQTTAVTQFVSDLDANPTKAEPGLYRTFHKKTAAGPQTERQIITAAKDEKVTVETRNVTLDKTTQQREIDLRNPDPLEKALRLFAKGENEALYDALAFYLPGFFKVAPEAFKDYTVTIDVRSAEYLDDTTFRLLLKVRVTELPRSRSLAFEVRFSRTLPKPFNVIYVAWGADRPIRHEIVVTEYGTRADETIAAPPAAQPEPPQAGVETHRYETQLPSDHMIIQVAPAEVTPDRR